MHEYIVYILIAVWLIGTIGLFAHELWVCYKHPEVWANRNQGITKIADWQVWLVMVFWPCVLIAGGVSIMLTFIGSIVTAFWQARKSNK